MSTCPTVVTNTQLNADQSAALLTKRIRERQPFLFLRYGDGALECIAGRSGQTRDGEIYTPELKARLLGAWGAAAGAADVFVGDWMSASFEPGTENTRYAEQYARLAAPYPVRWLHFEALLLMRESRELVDFYRAVKQDARRKLFMGPSTCAGAARMLGAEHLVTPMTADLHRYFENQQTKLRDIEFDVLLYGAGMAAHPQVIDCWVQHPERTYVNLGSAMDPLFRGKTRRQQIAPARARQVFRELLATPNQRLVPRLPRR